MGFNKITSLSLWSVEIYMTLGFINQDRPIRKHQNVQSNNPTLNFSFKHKNNNQSTFNHFSKIIDKIYDFTQTTILFGYNSPDRLVIIYRRNRFFKNYNCIVKSLGKIGVIKLLMISINTSHKTCNWLFINPKSHNIAFILSMNFTTLFYCLNYLLLNLSYHTLPQSCLCCNYGKTLISTALFGQKVDIFVFEWVLTLYGNDRLR